MTRWFPKMPSLMQFIVLPPWMRKPCLGGLFRAAVAAAEPGRLVGKALRRSASGLTLTAGGVSSGLGLDDLRKIYLVGGGEAGRAMGEAAMRILGEQGAAGGVAGPRGG